MSEAPRPRHSIGAWVAVLILVLLAGAGAALYFFGEQYLAFSLAPGAPEGDTSRTILLQGEEPPSLAGKLLLTMRNTQNQAMGVYAHDFASGSFSHLSRFGINSVINPRVSPDRSNITFVSRDGEESLQVFVADDVKGTRQISKNEILYKREPTWSPQGNRIAYVARGADEEEEKEDHHAEGWAVYVADADGSREEYVGRGYSPVFSPDGKKLLYIRGDGLYLSDIDSKAAQKVWEVEGGSAHSHMKLALSPDFSTLAWADHHAREQEGNVVLFHIDSWEEFSMKPTTQLFTAGVFMAFSPDGKHLAVQTNEVVWNGDHTQTDLLHPKVVIYPLQGGTMRTLLNLGGFDPSYLWVDQWIPAGIELN